MAVATVAQIRNHIVEVARSYHGTRTGSEKHQELVNIWNSIPGQTQPATTGAAWCALFVCTVVYKSGYPEATFYNYGCGGLKRAFEDDGKWHSIADVKAGKYDPQPGDFVIHSKQGNTKNPQVFEHVGMLTEFSRSGNEVNMKTIDGNYYSSSLGYSSVQEIPTTWFSNIEPCGICELKFSTLEPLPPPSEEQAPKVPNVEVYYKGKYYKSKVSIYKDKQWHEALPNIYTSGSWYSSTRMEVLPSIIETIPPELGQEELEEDTEPPAEQVLVERAIYICESMKLLGWSLNSTCAFIGMSQVISGLNPANQSGMRAGLLGWNAAFFRHWAEKNDKDVTTIDASIFYFDGSFSYIFFPTLMYPLPYTMYKSSFDSPENLTGILYTNYMVSGLTDEQLEEAKAHARTWYDYLRKTVFEARVLINPYDE